MLMHAEIKRRLELVQGMAREKLNHRDRECALAAHSAALGTAEGLDALLENNEAEACASLRFAVEKLLPCGVDMSWAVADLPVTAPAAPVRHVVV